MTFKNLFLSLLGMLVVYHCAEMESPLTDITAPCLLKHKVDDGLKGFAASRAVMGSLVQLWSRNNSAAPTACVEPNQPQSGWSKGRVEVVSDGAEPSDHDCWSEQRALPMLSPHACWLTLPLRLAEQRR